MINKSGLATYEDQLQSAADFIRKHDDFLVVSHLQPDGDAAGSTAAVALLLQSLNKRFVLVNEGEVPRKFTKLLECPSIVDFSTADVASAAYSTIITVDCADYARIGRVTEWFAPGRQLLNLDHHQTNDGFGTVNVVNTGAAATAEIVFDLVQALHLPIHPPLANAIYMGLLTDTGGFRYANTTPKVMEIASTLLGCGANGQELAEQLLETVTRSHIRLLSKALSELQFSKDSRIAWVQLNLQDMLETDAGSEDYEGIVNYPRNIEGVEVGLCFREQESNRIKVSLRSSGEVDVSRIAQSFGGGGHMRAAGCTLKVQLSEAVSAVVLAVEAAMVPNG